MILYFNISMIIKSFWISVKILNCIYLFFVFILRQTSSWLTGIKRLLIIMGELRTSFYLIVLQLKKIGNLSIRKRHWLRVAHSPSNKQNNQALLIVQQTMMKRRLTKHHKRIQNKTQHRKNWAARFSTMTQLIYMKYLTDIVVFRIRNNVLSQKKTLRLSGTTFNLTIKLTQFCLHSSQM